MDKLMFGLMILSWIGSVIGGAWFAMALYSNITYEGSLTQKLDACRGFQRKWPIARPFWITLISIVFLISYYFG